MPNRFTTSIKKEGAGREKGYHSQFGTSVTERFLPAAREQPSRELPRADAEFRVDHTCMKP